MHNDEVMIKSTAKATIAGPAAAAPKSATNSGTPMKPVFGKAATSAPKDASFQPMRGLRLTATVKPTMISAQSKYTPIKLPSSSCPMGVLAPNRNNMQGSAKYSTKAFSPGMAACGNQARRAAT